MEQKKKGQKKWAKMQKLHIAFHPESQYDTPEHGRILSEEEALFICQNNEGFEDMPVESIIKNYTFIEKNGEIIVSHRGSNKLSRKLSRKLPTRKNKPDSFYVAG